MATALDAFPATFAPTHGTVRREQRDELVRIVEYSCFPRVSPQQRQRIGFTRDVSRSGLCLGVDRSEPVGSLLRLSLRDIDGHSSDPRVGRVVWNSSERDGRHWLGLELLTPAPTGCDVRAPSAERGAVSRPLFR
jgi:hypothetical protein